LAAWPAGSCSRAKRSKPTLRCPPQTTNAPQARWFGGGAVPASAGAAPRAVAPLSPEQADVLRKLPIYEAHPPLPHERPQAPAGGLQQQQQQQQQRQHQQQQEQQQQEQQPPAPLLAERQEEGREGGAAAGGAGVSTEGERSPPSQQQPEEDAQPRPDGAAAGAPPPAPPDRPPAAAAAAAAAAPGRFVSLVAAVKQLGCALPPPGAPPELLGSKFLRCDGAGEEAVLEAHLGVPRARLSAFMRDHVAPHAAGLDAAALSEVVAGALRALRQLAGADPDLVEVLRWGKSVWWGPRGLTAP
jgi:hypothetical protein